MIVIILAKQCEYYFLRSDNHSFRFLLIATLKRLHLAASEELNGIGYENEGPADGHG